MDRLLSKIHVLQETTLFKDLTLDVLQEIAYRIQRKKTNRGEVVFAEGDIPNGFYIISSGEVMLQKKGSKAISLKENDFFGESCLLNNDPSSVTASSENEAILLYLSKEEFNKLITSYPEVLSKIIHKVISDLKKTDDPERFVKSQNLYALSTTKSEKDNLKPTTPEDPEQKKIFDSLREAPLFKGLSNEALISVAKETTWKKAAKGEVIFSTNDKPDNMYIISKGSVFIKKGNKEISLLNGHDFFGEVGVVTNQARRASVIAIEDSVFLQISKKSFNKIISTHPSIARSILFKMISYNYPDYQLQDENVLFKIEKLLPQQNHTLDPQMFFESLGLSKSKTITVLDLYENMKKDCTYYIDEKGVQEKKPDNKDATICNLEESIHSKTIPEYIEIEGIWDDSCEENGKFILHVADLEIPVLEATEDSLAYYDAKLLNTGKLFKFPQDLPLWNVFIGKEYLKNFIMTEKGGGIPLECQMDQPHLHMPLNKEAYGYYVLGKKVNLVNDQKGPARYQFSAFKIPFEKAIYTPPGVIHCDAGLQGNWLIGCSRSKETSSRIMKTERGEIATIHFKLVNLIQKNIFISIYPE